jgi:hypothetical protein
MVTVVEDKELMLGPRDKGVAFTAKFENIHTLSVDETILLAQMSITGVKKTHNTMDVPEAVQAVDNRLTGFAVVYTSCFLI